MRWLSPLTRLLGADRAAANAARACTDHQGALAALEARLAAFSTPDGRSPRRGEVSRSA